MNAGCFMVIWSVGWERAVRLHCRCGWEIYVHIYTCTCSTYTNIHRYMKCIRKMLQLCLLSLDYFTTDNINQCDEVHVYSNVVQLFLSLFFSYRLSPFFILFLSCSSSFSLYMSVLFLFSPSARGHPPVDQQHLPVWLHPPGSHVDHQEPHLHECGQAGDDPGRWTLWGGGRRPFPRLADLDGQIPQREEEVSVDKVYPISLPLFCF